MTAKPAENLSDASSAAPVSLEPVLLEMEGAIATLRLNRPQVRNALSRALFRRMDEHIATIEARDEVRTVVVAGNGPSFCAGADLNELAEPGSPEAMQAEMQNGAVFERLAALPTPLVAAVQGFAVGGGFLLTLYCDVRIATEDARLGFPAASRHWLPPWAMSRLAAWIGPARAEQMLLVGGTLSAAEARHYGLIEHVVLAGELAAKTREVAEGLANSRREVVREIRQFFRQLPGQDHAHWDRIATEAFARLVRHPEAQAAIRAFRARA